MTPTSLIYKAWENTPKPVVYQTNDAKGNPLEVICHFINPKDHKDFAEKQGVCPICGQETSSGIPSKKFFSANYTDWSIHKDPTGDLVCESCAFTMLLNPKKGRMTLSRYSFCAGETLEILNRGQVRDRLISPPEPPFVFAIAVSQKKHIAIKSKLSYSKKQFLVNLEEDTIPVNRELCEKYIIISEALRGIGFTKEEIEKKQIRFDKVKNYKSDAVEIIEKLYQEMSDKRLAKMAIYVSKKMELEEAECYMGLTPKMIKQQPQHSSRMQSTKAETLREDRADTKCGRKSSDSQEQVANGQLTLELF